MDIVIHSPLQSKHYSFLVAHALHSKLYTTKEIPIDSVSHLPCNTCTQQTFLTMLPVSFEEYVTNVDNWKTDLIINVQLLPGTKITTVLEAVLSGNVLLASDGSFQSKSLSFGWVIARQTYRIQLVECKGWVYGFQSTSYRAKIYGGWSIFQYLYWLATYFNITILNGLIWICDNESLITTSTTDILVDRNDNLSLEQLEDPSYTPSVLQTNWDALLPISNLK